MRLLLGFVLALQAVASAASVVDQRPIAPGQSIHLRVDAGAVVVGPGDAGEVAVDAALSPGQRLRWREGGDRLVLVVDDRERLSPRPVALTLSVPAGADLVISLGEASLRLGGLEGGRLRVDGGAGAVAVDAAMREVHVETRAGRIEVRGGAERIVARSLAGEQQIVAGGPARLDAETVSGALDARLVAGGTVRLASTSGPITLHTGPAAGLDARLDSLSGNLELRVPAGETLAVRALQARGEADFPGSFTMTADGLLRNGEGGGRVRASSFTGNLKLVVVPGGPMPGDAPRPP
ncbi:hypothetical protein GCM10028794_02580 [Silanimonas algicola]